MKKEEENGIYIFEFNVSLKTQKQEGNVLLLFFPFFSFNSSLLTKSYHGIYIVFDSILNDQRRQEGLISIDNY